MSLSIMEVYHKCVSWMYYVIMMSIMMCIMDVSWMYHDMYHDVYHGCIMLLYIYALQVRTRTIIIRKMIV